jgi:hypothetical protein
MQRQMTEIEVRARHTYTLDKHQSRLTVGLSVLKAAAKASKLLSS